MSQRARSALDAFDPGPSVIGVWRDLALELILHRAVLDAWSRDHGGEPLPPLLTLRGKTLAHRAVRLAVDDHLTKHSETLARVRRTNGAEGH